jgi:protein transport protein SEC13
MDLVLWLCPVQRLASGGCGNTVKVWKLWNGTWKIDFASLPSCIPIWEMWLGAPASKVLSIASSSQDGTVVMSRPARDYNKISGLEMEILCKVTF